MKGTVKLLWLYLRMAGLGLAILFAMQLVFINIAGDGPAKVLPWMSGYMNVWAILCALVVGALLLPIYKATRKTWRDYQAHRAVVKDQSAERAAREAGHLKAAPEAPAAQQPGARPVESSRAGEARPSAGQAASARPAQAEDRPSAADVWTSGDEPDEGPKKSA